MASLGLHIKRAGKEVSQLMGLVKSPEMPNLISVSLPSEDNVLEWHVELLGPNTSPFQGIVFKLAVEVPSDYPHVPASVKFATPIYHPGVTDDGKLCEALMSDWAPSMTVKDILVRILELMHKPQEFPFVNDVVAKLFTDERATYERRAAEQAKKHGRKP